MKDLIAKLQESAIPLLHQSHFDHLAVGIINFRENNFDYFQVAPSDVSDYVYFDLASVTKPLVLASTYLAHPEWFGENEKLLLNHEAGIPSWGRISQSDWRGFLKEFPIKKSPNTYSDYSALRLMVELEEKQKISLKTLAQNWWDPELVFWHDLPLNAHCPPTGFRHGHMIQGEVHDPNAYVINEFCSHAGLFGTIQGVCRTLINLESKYQLMKVLKKEFENNKNLERFILGWDRVTDPVNTLAGTNASLKTFGHLGFTGTSVWMDCEKAYGIVILSNATKLYWYDKEDINRIRRTLGKILWETV